jgi:hypothetical protein
METVATASFQLTNQVIGICDELNQPLEIAQGPGERILEGVCQEVIVGVPGIAPQKRKGQGNNKQSAADHRGTKSQGPGNQCVASHLTGNHGIIPFDLLSHAGHAGYHNQEQCGQKNDHAVKGPVHTVFSLFLDSKRPPVKEAVN